MRALRLKGSSRIKAMILLFEGVPDTEPFRGFLQRAVQGPERCVVQAGRCKKMDVDESEAYPDELMRLDEAQDLVMAGDGGLGQRPEQIENLDPAGEPAAGKFPKTNG